MSHTCHSLVLSSVTRLLAVSESIAEVPHRQVAKQANQLFLFFFREATTIMAEAITMIQMQRSGNIHGVLHSYKSVFKELEVLAAIY